MVDDSVFHSGGIGEVTSCCPPLEITGIIRDWERNQLQCNEWKETVLAWANSQDFTEQTASREASLVGATNRKRNSSVTPSW